MGKRQVILTRMIFLIQLFDKSSAFNRFNYFQKLSKESLLSLLVCNVLKIEKNRRNVFCYCYQ
jgi:hypothetical protein